MISKMRKRILLLSDMPPCTNYSGGIHLSQLIKILLKNDFEVFNFCVMDLSVEPVPDKELEGIIDYKMFVKPRETIVRRLDKHFLESSTKKAIKECIKYVQNNRIENIWCPIQGEVLARILDAVSRETQIPYVPQLWDPIEWYMHEYAFSPERVENTLALYNDLIRRATSCVTASPSMSEFYSSKFNGNYYDVETMISENEYRYLKGENPKNTFGKKIIISMCGQTYAKDAIESFFEVLESMNWELNGKKIYVYHYGGPFSFTIDENKYKKNRIVKKGHYDQEELIHELRKADFLYCPYFFTKQYPYKQVSEMSFPSKLVTYFGVEMVPIILHAPEYSSPSCYCKKRKCAIILETCVKSDLQKKMNEMFSAYEKNTSKLLEKQTKAKIYFSEKSISNRFLEAINFDNDNDRRNRGQKIESIVKNRNTLSSSIDDLRKSAEKQKRRTDFILLPLKVVYYFNLIVKGSKNQLIRPTVLLRNSIERALASWSVGKAKILYLNNIDKYGKVFNGYDSQRYFNAHSDTFQAKLLVNYKLTRDKNVVRIFNDPKICNYAEKIAALEAQIMDTKGQLSIVDVILAQSKLFSEADIVHINMCHNMHLSVPFLKEIRAKNIIIDIHDTFFLTDDCECSTCIKKRGERKKIKMWGGIFDSKSNKHELHKQKKSVLCSLDAHFLTHSDYFKKFFTESPVTKSLSAIDVIRFGIDTNMYKNNHNQKALRAKFHIPENNLVLFCRALSERKGIENIEAALLSLEMKNVTVLTCSGIGLLDSVSNKYQVIDRGEVPQEELIDLFNVCDIFLCPSSEESFGFMAIEAMSCETPVIIFDNTALPSTTFAPDCGYLVHQGDDMALANAINELSSSVTERERRGALGRKLVEEHYSLDKYYKKLDELYKKLSNEGPRTLPKITEEFVVNDNARALILKLKKIYGKLELKTEFNEAFPQLKTPEIRGEKKNQTIEYSSENIQALLKYFNRNVYGIIKKESKVLPSIERAMRRVRSGSTAKS